MVLAEILTPDGDGDEERGIQQLESYANSSPRPAHASRGRVLYADPHYREYRPGGADAATERTRKEQTDRRNAASPSLHFMSGMATSATASFGAPRRRQRPAGFGRGGLPPILPGGGFGPTPHEDSAGKSQGSPLETVEVPREMRINAAGEASGHLIVSHSTKAAENQLGPEVYLG